MNSVSIRVDFVFNEKQLDRLVGLAQTYGYLRENPRKAWTQREYKEAARLAIDCAVNDLFNFPQEVDSNGNVLSNQ